MHSSKYHRWIVLDRLIILALCLCIVQPVNAKSNNLSLFDKSIKQQEQSSLFSCATVGGITVSECEALVALYDNIDGEYLANRGWKQNDAPCSWGGVTCEAGHVVQLDMYVSTGSIAVELGNFVYLASLTIYGQLSGSIPSSIGNLTNLVYLNLSGNELSGSIPSSLGYLTKLKPLI